MARERSRRTWEEEWQEDQSGRDSSAAVENDDLFFLIGTEGGNRVLIMDKGTEPKLIVGIHENGIDADMRLICPANRGQPDRQRLLLSRNVQM